MNRNPEWRNKSDSENETRILFLGFKITKSFSSLSLSLLLLSSLSLLPFDFSLTLQEGLTALHLAVQSGKPEVVEVLLGHGASVHLKSGKTGETPLHACARAKNGHECADLLIKSGAPINETNEVSLHFLSFSCWNFQIQTLDLELITKKFEREVRLKRVGEEDGDCLREGGIQTV